MKTNSRGWGMVKDVETDLEGYGWSWKVLVRGILWQTCLDSLKCCWIQAKKAITDLIWFVLAVEPGGKEEKCIKISWRISHRKADFPKAQVPVWSWVYASENYGTKVKSIIYIFQYARPHGFTQRWKFRKTAPQSRKSMGLGVREILDFRPGSTTY